MAPAARVESPGVLEWADRFHCHSQGPDGDPRPSLHHACCSEKSICPEARLEEFERQQSAVREAARAELTRRAEEQKEQDELEAQCVAERSAKLAKERQALDAAWRRRQERPVQWQADRERCKSCGWYVDEVSGACRCR